MIRRPPQHRVDAPILYVPNIDTAWDHDRIERERKETPKGQHPVDRYHSGDTRYDIDAVQTVGGTEVKPRDYFSGTPTVFKLRRVMGLEREKAIAVWNDDIRREESLWHLVKIGLSEISDGFDGDPWDLRGGVAGLPLTDDDVQAIYDANKDLIALIGLAVLRAAAGLSESEGKG